MVAIGAIQKRTVRIALTFRLGLGAAGRGCA
ncbi:Uncharacterised protein [Mycobacterium tuberculosis]|uniref:Uncharacterized protein n=1 Tax=Mycobacterium tuberculosis TaxID=1773 RepID=A0A0T9DBN8_MYCTX|nr:Uncharacterised protein [Mycobacterium tuberculosis]CKS21752.1 Uncharacterised protein [Mycobacterium tuberculosis]CKU34808.1 Uncharacterised protein [Mycobacterium tuberculosis]COW20435.1 Uncharacterised protein [Mycobacterium tuberculosis]COW35776.1 Uncharacterised protein [Mycobacterium tuberculosis]